MTATCIICNRLFTKQRMGQKVCGPVCAGKVAKTSRKAVVIKERESTKLRKAKLKTKNDWTKEAQIAINAYIRARDKDLSCISCGRYHQGQWHAGHYMSIGARPELRFNENNIHKQCQPCNTHLHGNLLLYRKALILKIGFDMVEYLEGFHPINHYSPDDLINLKLTYIKKLKDINND